MAGILPDCVNMLYLLTDLYKKSYLTREEFIEHARLKVAFLSDHICQITNIRDKISVLKALQNCCDCLVSYNHVIQ